MYAYTPLNHFQCNLHR